MLLYMLMFNIHLQMDLNPTIGNQLTIGIFQNLHHYQVVEYITYTHTYTHTNENPI